MEWDYACGTIQYFLEIKITIRQAIQRAQKTFGFAVVTFHDQDETARGWCSDVANEMLYELDDGYEMSDWAITLIKADGYEETGRDDNTENWMKWRAMDWEIEVDLNGIRRMDRD